jgi:uncharacterized membrane protein YdjX (TVP38/TMEM64 family)
MLVLAVTAYPAGPMSGAFWASGFSSMRWLPFLIAVTLGGAVRSFAYSVFGATLLDAGSTRFWIVATVLALAVTLPLLVPGVRRRMFAVEE